MRFLALFLVFALAGCADYLNRYDTVTLAAGDAQKHNLMLHTVKPLNPESRNTTIESDGARVAAVLETYRPNTTLPGQARGTGMGIGFPGEGSPGEETACLCPYDTATDGSICGDRSVWSRSGQNAQCDPNRISAWQTGQ